MLNREDSINEKKTMKILVTGGCGFIGSNICLKLKKDGQRIFSLDNLSGHNSKQNLKDLSKNKIKNYKIDISNYNQIKKLQKFDIIIDCCAEAAVETSRNNTDKVIMSNLFGTYNILRKVKKDNSKLIFFSTSRVYSISEINKLIKKNQNTKISIKKEINENFETLKPKSLYGFSKHASEMMIEEFAYAFNIKYIINRCGVISGPRQFGRQEQGFVSLWVWHHLIKKKLSYIGYGGTGHQVRDILHVDDLLELLKKQIKQFKKINNKLFCVGGSYKNKISLKELTILCKKITNNKVNFTKIKKTSIYDIPYFITDISKVSKFYNWKPKKNIFNIVKDTYHWLLDNKDEFLKK